MKAGISFAKCDHCKRIGAVLLPTMNFNLQEELECYVQSRWRA
jgi:hypothetical protein